MLLFDRLLVSGLSFVLDKVATIAGGELNDAERVREALLAAQLELEEGAIDDATFRAREVELIARLRAIRDAQRADDAGEVRVAGVEAHFADGEIIVQREFVPARRTTARGATTKTRASKPETTKKTARRTAK